MQTPDRILFGITTFSHTELTLSEMRGLQEMGYTCGQFEYGARKNYTSAISRAYIIMLNCVKLLRKAYRFRPDYIYLNSRLDFKGAFRDFLTIFVIRTFYFKKVFFFIKSHGSDLEVLQTQKFPYKRFFFPYLRHNVNAWLFLSNEELKWIISNKLLDEERLFLAKNIVDAEKFKPDPQFKQSFNIPADHKILLFAGRMIKQKGIYDIIDAYANIRKNYKTTLLLVGDGEEMAAIKEKIEKSQMGDQIIVTGWVTEEKAAYFTANSDMLVFPTYFPEGFPMALFNSVAAGLNILTTPVRAAIDYLKEPENCIWVQPKSSASIETGIRKLFEYPDMTREMKMNNRELSVLFSKAVVAKELSSMMETVKQRQS